MKQVYHSFEELYAAMSKDMAQDELASKEAINEDVR
jgi:hypothetical protein